MYASEAENAKRTELERQRHTRVRRYRRLAFRHYGRLAWTWSLMVGPTVLIGSLVLGETLYWWVLRSGDWPRGAQPSLPPDSWTGWVTDPGFLIAAGIVSAGAGLAFLLLAGWRWEVPADTLFGRRAYPDVPLSNLDADGPDHQRLPPLRAVSTFIPWTLFAIALTIIVTAARWMPSAP